MPSKIRELIKRLQAAGFADRGGRGSHRNFSHPKGPRITISGNSADDAKSYQERGVEKAIKKAQK
ncbi:MAG: type II toxin-antitoxin system HicA family toxin [Lentisphaeria bacterium]|nr:type II toxin-antitoxin system HicA family toxin [Lentisphaeria bacterium]